MANNAFDAMNNSADDDMFITGGALFLSEYENNMTPQDQSRYEDKLLEKFQVAYQRDPYKQNLDFDHWLKTLNPDLYRERAERYDAIKAENQGIYKLMDMDPLEGALIRDAGLLQDLAHLHTGRMEDIIRIVEDMDIQMPQQQMNPGMQQPPVQGMQNTGPSGQY